MKKIAFFGLVLTSIFLVGCNKSPETISSLSGSETCSLTETGNACTASGEEENTNMTALDTAKAILQSLKDKNFQTLATFVGPQGIRFSPYTYVNTGTDIILDAEVVANGLAISSSYVWGAYDGSGEPIDLGILPYFEKFVYDLDFLNAPEVNENQEVMRGNVINNIFDVYSDKYVIEFFIPGIDPQYDGMDRRSLTLVLENTDGTRHLIGIVHNQWTI